MLPRGRVVSLFLVYVLSTTMLVAQQQSLTGVPLTTRAAAPAPPQAVVPATAAQSNSSASPPAARFEAAGGGAAGPSASTGIEPEYFYGMASSSYPLSVPRGRGGMTPELSIDYRSGAGNGWLGVGWDLQPGSIERQTKSGVHYDLEQFVYRTTHASEALVKTGENLFATEIASRFEKFEKKIDATLNPYWVVTDTRGTIRQYGSTAASRVANPAAPSQIFAWRLDRVTDLLGNVTALTYTANGGNLFLQDIRYAESPGLPATNVITFDNEARPDVERSFETGFEVRTALRLKAVLVRANGQSMPSLALDYGTAASDATGRSLLRSISIVSADGSKKLPPTQYRYQGGRLSITSPVRTGGPVVTSTVNKQCLSGDFNGDTYSDVACYAGSGTWNLTLSSAIGWTTALIAGPRPGADATRQCTTGDFNADGRTDLLCYTTVGGQWDRMNGTATGWESAPPIFASAVGLPIYHQCVTGDMNADGRTDIMCWKGGSNWELTVSRDDAWDAPVTVTNGPIVSDVAERCTAADFDGDSRTDITCFTGNENLWYIGFSTGSGWRVVFRPGPRTDVPLGHRCLFADYNGDRRTDMLCFSGGNRPGTQWTLSRSTDTGFDATTTFTGPTVYTPVADHCVALDVNGDGKADLQCWSPNWRTFISSGESFRDEGFVPGPTFQRAIGEECIVGDFNGDGKGDLGCHAGQNWQMMLSGGVTPDLLSSTTNMFGGVTTVEYSRAVTMANTRIPFPLDVMTRSIALDGTGRQAVTNIAYAGGYFDVATRDFRGFRNARVAGPVTDGAGGTAVIRYHQGSSVEFGANDAAAAGAYMRGRPDRLLIRDKNGDIVRETRFLYGEAGGVSRFHPLTETSTIACENNVCNEETRTVNTYDRFGNVVRVEDSGDLTRLDDDLTKITTFAYNEAKYIVSIPASEELRRGVPAGERLAYTENFFDGTDTCNTAATATVPERGQITRIARWVANGTPMVEERAAFDSAGNVVCRADAMGYKSTFTYDASKIFLLSAQNALGHKIVFTYYGVGGQPVDRGLYGLPRTSTDPNGAVSTMEWDSFGRKTRTIAPLGSTTTWTYTDLGTPLQQNIRTTNTGLSTTVYLDGFGRTVRTRRSGPEQKNIITTTRYDERGLAVATSLPYFEGQTPAAETRVVYDTLRRPAEERDAAGNVRTLCYSSGATDLIDENGHRTRRVVNARGRLVQVERYTGTYGRDCAALPLHGTGVVPPYSITQYREDPLGRLTQIIDAKGVVTTIEYDGLGRRTHLVDPAVGERHFSFSAAGDEIGWESSTGAAVYAMFDVLHRPIQKDFNTRKAAGFGDAVFTYDEAGRNGIGRLTSARNANATHALTYDLEGRVTAAAHTIGGTIYREERKYDALGRTIEVVYPDGKRVTQTFDGPTVKSVFSGSTTYATYSAYNAAGFAEQVRYGNGTASTSTYETPSNPECSRATYRLCTTKTIAADHTVVLDVKYGYDAKGNVTSAREPDVVRSYLYDDLDRLRAVASSRTGVAADAAYRNAILAADLPREWASLSAPSNALQLEEGFTYDSADDITWKWDMGAYEYPRPTAAAMNPHAPRKVGNEALTWNPDGQLLSGFGRTSAYDTEGRVVAIDLPANKQRAVHRGPGAPRSYQYQYDANGSRVRESGPRGVTTYVGDLTECRASGGCVNHVYAGVSQVATESADGSVAYYHRDHQRSVRAITNGSGRTIASYHYGSYGAPAPGVATPSFLSTSMLFGSQPFAEEAGVYSFDGRAYDPRLGRFLSPDDVVPVAGSPQYLNRYIYAHDNPVSVIDPDGHIPFFLAGLIFGAIVGALTAQFQHADWRRGALFGAISGAITGLPYDITNGTVSVFVGIVTGAAGGGITAAIGGGNIARGILGGAVRGLLGHAGYGQDGAMGFWNARADGVFGVTIQTIAKSAFHGAMYGGLHAAATGDDIMSGILHGMRGGALGTVANMAIGHALGIVGVAISRVSGLSSDTGFMDRGQFVYNTPVYGKLLGGFLTLGNVTLNSASPGRGCWDANDQWIARHETDHRNWQDPVLGAAYLPAHALSLTLGFIAEGGKIREGHDASFLENHLTGTPESTNPDQ